MEDDATLHARALKILAEGSERRREEKAKRMVWHSKHVVAYGAVFGRPDTMSLMEEAREAYIDGLFISVVFVTCAYMEHVTVDAVQGAGEEVPRTWKKAIDAARRLNLFNPQILDDAEVLMLRRNALAHRRDSDDADTIGQRYLMQKRHIKSVLEEDAQLGIKLIYAYYPYAVRPMDPGEDI